ncbi:MAG: helix-turn-helix domain-containing protein [Bacteroidota bacterium]
MPAKKVKLLPKQERMLQGLGERLKLARLRRRLTTSQVAERAYISRSTLWHVEKGSPHISMGIYFRVLSVLGLAEDMEQVAKDDVLGRKLQDIGLIPKQRAPKTKKKS